MARIGNMKLCHVCSSPVSGTLVGKIATPEFWHKASPVFLEFMDSKGLERYMPPRADRRDVASDDQHWVFCGQCANELMKIVRARQ